MAPWPTTRTVCPFSIPALRTAFRHVLTGSTKEATSAGTRRRDRDRSLIDDPVHGLHVLPSSRPRRLNPPSSHYAYRTSHCA